MTISHRIELIPNNKAKTHFRQAFGCSRLAYNWGLAKWKEYYENGKKVSYLDLKKEFNSIKKDKYPFVYNVSKYATQQPFLNLNEAFNKFFRDLKKGMVSYPKFKKKRENSGSYYIGGDQVVLTNKPKISKKLDINANECRYLKVPNFGFVKMTEALRFKGKINSVVISQKADKFFASFSVEITQAEFERTHKKSINDKIGLGIDVGLSSFATLSNGLMIQAPKPLKEQERMLIRKTRQLSRKVHPKTKGDKTSKSSNYLKSSLILSKNHNKISNIREDFEHKLSTAIICYHGIISLENLNVGGMKKNHHLAKSISDVSFYNFRRMLDYKAHHYNKQIIYADRFYPSSQICNNCGHRQKMPLNKRTYSCPQCGNVIDRDYNASINLYKLISKKIGRVPPEYTLADLTALQNCLVTNKIATSKVETRMQHKF